MLEHTDWEFTCVCSWRHQGNPLNIPIDRRVQVVTHDLTGPLPDLGDFEHILHLAAESHVDRSIAQPVEFIENNVSSALQMLEYARKHPPSTFLLFSTDEVYGATHHEEWDVLLPSNPYSASKAAQEMIGIAYWSTYRVPVVITNSNNIVGPNQNKEKYLPKLIDLISRGEEVTIHVSSTGKPGKRYYNPVQNTGSALKFILNQNLFRAKRPARFSLPGGEELDNQEFAELVAESLGLPLKSRQVEVSSIRPGYDEFYAKTDGWLEEVGWKPEVSLREALPDIIRSYLE